VNSRFPSNRRAGPSATRAAVGSLGRIGVEVDEVLVVSRLVVGGGLALWLRFRSLLAKAHWGNSSFGVETNPLI
jgi:hypothetical protein